MSKKCSYCLREKEDKEFGSVEHIWPQALGNKISHSIFLTKDVCNRCNSLAGMHVDARFVKNWFVSNDLASASNAVLDPSNPSAAQFAYFGKDEDFPCPEGWACEHLCGAAGEHIYYVRPDDDDAWWSYVCGNPKRQVRRKARVYCVLTSQSEFWFHVFYHSIQEAFKHESVYCLTTITNSDDEEVGLFQPIPEDDPDIKRETEFINQRSDEKRKVNFSIGVNFADRFMCKVALGLGRNLFGEKFLDRPLTEIMSHRLWERDAEERAMYPIYGNPFSWESNELPAMDFKASYILILNSGSAGIGLTVQHPSKRISAIKISEHPEDLAAFYAQYQMGVVFVVTPALRSFIGPFDFMNFIAHLTPSGPKISELEELQSRVRTVDELPSRENSATRDRD